MTGKLFRALLGGLMLAGIVHIVAVLWVPEAAIRDATGRVLAAVPSETLAPIPADGTVLPDLDPFFLHAACPFSSADTALTLTGQPSSNYWSVAVVSRQGGLVASFESGAFPSGTLDLAVGTTQALETLRVGAPAGGTGRTLVDIPPGPGFVMVRASAADPDDRAFVRDALAAIQCSRVPAR